MPHHVDLTIRLLESPHDSVVSFPQTEYSWRAQGPQPWKTQTTISEIPTGHKGYQIQHEETTEGYEHKQAKMTGDI